MAVQWFILRNTIVSQGFTGGPSFSKGMILLFFFGGGGEKGGGRGFKMLISLDT